MIHFEKISSILAGHRACVAFIGLFYLLPNQPKNCKIETDTYIITPDFISMYGYSGNKGNLLGLNGDLLKNVYELEGLPTNDYIYYQDGFFVGSPSISLLRNKNADEPLFFCKINKLVINKSDGITVIIEDENVRVLTYR